MNRISPLLPAALAATLFAGACATARAQGVPAPANPYPAAAGTAVGAQATPAGVHGRMNRREAMRDAALAGALGLDPKTAVELAGTLDSYDPQLAAAGQSIRSLRKQIRAYAQGAPATEADVQTTLGNLRNARQQVQQIAQNRLNAVAALLTPNQLARFTLVMPRIQHRLAHAARLRHRRARIHARARIAPRGA